MVVRPVHVSEVEAVQDDVILHVQPLNSQVEVSNEVVGEGVESVVGDCLLGDDGDLLHVGHVHLLVAGHLDDQVFPAGLGGPLHPVASSVLWQAKNLLGRHGQCGLWHQPFVGLQGQHQGVLDVDGDRECRQLQEDHRRESDGQLDPPGHDPEEQEVVEQVHEDHL